MYLAQQGYDLEHLLLIVSDVLEDHAFRIVSLSNVQGVETSCQVPLALHGLQGCGGRLASQSIPLRLCD